MKEDEKRSSDDVCVDAHSSPAVAVICMDIHGVITSWNPGAEATLGWSSEEVVGRPLVDTLIPARYRAAHSEGLKRYMDTGEGPLLNRALDLVALHRDGREIPVAIAVAPVEVDHTSLFVSMVHSRDPETCSGLEQKRLAGDLHDGVAQILARAKISLAKLRSTEALEQVPEIADEVGGLIDRALFQMRSLILEMASPLLGDDNLEMSLQQLCADLEDHYGIRIEFEGDGGTEPLNDGGREAVVRATRELLVNVGRHSKADIVKVLLRRVDDHVVVRIEDNGEGFDLRRGPSARSSGRGFGLRLARDRMKEVGGRVEIQSAPGAGTQCVLRAPLQKGASPP